MNTWKVVRIVREVYEVEADTKEQAKDAALDPHTVEIVRHIVTIKPTKESEARHG